jgi:hypothetical protein
LEFIDLEIINSEFSIFESEVGLGELINLEPINLELISWELISLELVSPEIIYLKDPLPKTKYL